MQVLGSSRAVLGDSPWHPGDSPLVIPGLGDSPWQGTEPELFPVSLLRAQSLSCPQCPCSGHRELSGHKKRLEQCLKGAQHPGEPDQADPELQELQSPGRLCSLCMGRLF